MISVICITKNAEKTFEICLKSIKDLADDIVVVDDWSRDKTVEIAKKYGARIFQRKMEGFGRQKQYALAQAANDWVFLIDSDEEAAVELVNEIKKIVSEKQTCSAFRLRRKNIYFGKWLKRGGKYPDFQTRLMKKRECRFTDDIVHEKIISKGAVGTLQSPLIHNSYPDMKTWIRKLEMFSLLRGEELSAKGVRFSGIHFLYFCILRPSWRFFRRFILKLGFLDGAEGFLACLHDLLTEILGYCALIGNRQKS